ncbi:hypothetical protein T07_14188 [Trichinella nelsoni]|uniref:Uncharacterized protein n=1 Tax=Trichinella nelsoni TaxID=6336 RepID=A0A0V0REK8_9BILA|nr:hypothetical protein T07_4538 [Trichinella nelsoni]KRX15498.1 hypothetical protein T07_14188 [Trichinella nelsoni]
MKLDVEALCNEASCPMKNDTLACLLNRKLKMAYITSSLGNVQQNFVWPAEGTMDIKILDQEKTLQCCIMSLRVLRLINVAEWRTG